MPARLILHRLLGVQELVVALVHEDGDVGALLGDLHDRVARDNRSSSYIYIYIYIIVYIIISIYIYIYIHREREREREI